MRTLTAEILLRRLFEGREPDLFSLDLNVELRVKPWWPALPLVWAYRETELPPELAYEKKDDCWQDALALLTELHAQYRATHPKSSGSTH